MRRRLTLPLAFLTIFLLVASSSVMGAHKPGAKQEKSGLRSIYDPPDPFPPEYPGAISVPLSRGAFYPFVGKILSPGDTVGYTYYDYQKNGSMGRQIALDGAAGKHFAWMNQLSESGYRYADYNYQSSSGIWLGGVHVSPTTAGGGYTNIDLLSDNREIICYHQTQAGYPFMYRTNSMLAVENSDPGAGSFSLFDIPDSLPGAEYHGIWPYLAVDSADYIHVVMREGSTESAIRPFGYTRCYEDAESLKCEAPGEALVNIPPDQGQPTANMVAIIDSSGTSSVIVVSSPVSNKVAISYTKYRNPDLSQIDNDVYYVESTNGGQDWINAGSFSGVTKNNITGYQSTDYERAYCDVSAIYDYDDSLHIVWNAHWFHEGEYSVRYAKLYHWSKATGISRITSAYWEGTVPGSWNRNVCKMSISAKESNGNLYVTWTQFNPYDYSAGGYSNGEIYASASTDGGLSWDIPVNLTDTETPGCSPGDCESDHWSTLAEGIDDSLHIFYVNDRDAGGVPLGEGSWTQNPVLYMSYPAWNPLPHPVIEVDHQVYEDLSVPNNSTRDTSFVVNNWGNATLDVSITPYVSWINITSDSVLFIPAGEQEEVSLRFGDVSFSDTVLQIDSVVITSNDSAGNGHLAIPIGPLVVTDEEYYRRELQYVANSTMGLLESNQGSIAEGDPNGGMYTSTDELNYLYDASVFLATVNSNNDTLVSRNIYWDEFTHAAGNLVIDTLDSGDHLVIRSTHKFYPFFPHMGFPWPGWWWGVEISMENLMFHGDQAPVPENVMISTIRLYPKSPPAWWTLDTPPTLGDLYMGMVLDWDVPTDVPENNYGGYDDSYYLMWQNGAGGMSNYRAGLSFLENSSPYAARIIDLPTYVYPNNGFVDAELYQIASTPGDSVYGANVDLASVMTARDLTSLSDTVTVKFAMAVTSQGEIDLMNDINKARVYSGVLSGALAGDVDHDYDVDAADVVYLFDYLFVEGPEPVLWGSGDIDSAAGINIGDVIYLADYIFLAGPHLLQRPPFPDVAPEILTTDTLKIVLDSNPETGKYVYNLELTNSDTVFGLAIPVWFGIAQGTIQCDSASFVSTRLQGCNLFNGLLNNDEHKLLIGASNLSSATLNPGSGPIAKLYFTISHPSSAWSISFDTTFFEPSSDFLIVQGPLPRHLVVPQFEAPNPMQPPTPDFVGSPLIGEKNLTVTFSDSSEGIINSWYWSFGDGYSSIQQNPVHTYKVAGTYDVKLIVTNQFGSDTLIRENYIQVLAKPLADFAADPTVGSPPLGVQFTNNSIGNVTSWKWYFGDNDSSSLEDPYHEYSSFGTYDVTLIATSVNGTDSETKKNCIFAYPALSGDSVKILDVTAVPNQEDVIVPIIQSNVYDSLGRVKIPLTFGDSSVVQVDSVSFIGSRAVHFEQKSIDIDDGNAAILIDLSTDQSPYLEVGEGLLAKIYLKVKDVVSPAGVVFDDDPSDTMLFVFWDDYGALEADFCPGTLFVEKAETNPPDKPQNLVALPLESGVSLSWDAITDPDLRLYAVYKDYNRDSLDDTLATTDNPFYLDLTVSPGETLFYSVSAVDSSWNESEYSDHAHVIFGDTTPPVITVGPTLIGLSDTTATIYWETDEEADGYGEIYIDTNWVTADSHLTFLLEHTATVIWLEPSTSYPFRVRSTDSLDNGPTYSESDLLTTASGPDVTRPQIIFGPAVVYLTHNSATIQWTTDEIANSKVNYGENVPLSDSVLEPGFVTSHSVAVTGLSGETQYFYTVSSEDHSGNGPTYSDTLAFTTDAVPDTVPPAIVEGPVHSGITDNKAVISWVTDEISTGIVQYGPSELYGSERVKSDYVQNHQIVLTNLQDSTLYHYRVGSEDPESNGPTWSSNFWFSTRSAPDTMPPIILTGPYASWINNTQVQIDWTTDEVSDSWVRYGLGGSYNNVRGSATFVTQHSVVLTNLTPATTYDYYVSSTDASGNTVESEHEGGDLARLDTGDDQFTTKATGDATPPVIISGPHVRHKTHDQAMVEWVTDETGNSIVQYGLTQGYGTLTTYPEATINHTAFLSNLSPNTTYHFRVGSKDIANNGPTYSSDVTFTTSADVSDTEPPLITVAPGIAYADESRAIITWETDEPADSYMGYELIGLRAEKVVGESFCLVYHNMTLNLQSSYNVRVFSSDQLGNGPTYSDYFTVTALSTPDVTAPTVTAGPEVVYVSQNSAKVSWETDELSSSFVEYGLSGEYTEIEGNPDNDSLHEVILTNLASSTTYHYRIKSADLFGNTYLGSDETFGTESGSDVTPPARPTGLSTSYGDGWIKPRWSKNQEADLSGYNLRRGTALTDTTLPLIASNLSDTSYKDRGLTNGVTYYYQVAAVDRSSNESSVSEIVCSKALSYIVGDFNGDQEMNLVDVVSIINYVFKGAEGHEPLEAGNVNCSEGITITDIVYLINYMFRGGPDPCICVMPKLLARVQTKAKAIVGLAFSSEDKVETIGVLLEAQVDEEVAGLEFDLSLDPSRFEVETIKTTSRTEKLGLYYNVESGRVKVGMVDIYGVNTLLPGEGPVLEISLRQKEKAAAISGLKIDKAIVVNPSAEELEVQILPSKVTKSIPHTFSLAQNYPNPFNARTVINYSLPKDSEVKIDIYNILGQRVKTVVDEYQLAGYKTVVWDGTNEKGSTVASGIYLYRIQAGDFTSSRKMLLLK